MFKFTKKSTVGKFTSSLNDSDLKSHQSELEVWATSIKEEVNLLLAERVEGEAQKHEGFRALWTRESKSSSIEAKLKARLRFLDQISTYDYETSWRQIRKVGNATIYTQATEYQDWKGQAKSCTLLYTGKLGSGKTVLLANMVDDLNLSVQDQNTVVAYFFCRHDVATSLSTKTVIRSLVRQLLNFIPDLTEAASVLNDTILDPDFETVLNLLLPPTFKAYFVLDGLDEFDGNERAELLSALQDFQLRINLLLCISVRQNPDDPVKLQSEKFIVPWSILIPDENPDIVTFIDRELEDCIESHKLVMGQPELVLEIRDALLQKSQGMFLWVALQIISLCTMKTDFAIRQALLDLPRDLSETFARILARSGVEGQPYQKRILELLIVARRPLQLEELREALSVVEGNIDWDPALLLNNVYSTLACCGCLVTVDEEELTVRFVHHSFQQYLLFKSGEPYTTIRTANQTMARIIVTYLNYGIFDTQLTKAVVFKDTAGSMPSEIIRSTLDSRMVKSLALKLLKSKNMHQTDINKIFAAGTNRSKNRPVDQYYFYSYAKTHWHHHLLHTNTLDEITSNLASLMFGKGIVDPNVRPSNQALLSQAAYHGHEALVKLLINTGKVDINRMDEGEGGKSPLLWASLFDYSNIVKLLLDTGEVDVNIRTDIKQTPLLLASGNDGLKTVKLLLGIAETDIDFRGWNGETALSAAATLGYTYIVRALLETGGANIEISDDKHRTPLWWALKMGNEDVVKVLLEHGADVDAEDLDGKSPLTIAAQGANERIIGWIRERDKEILQSNMSLEESSGDEDDLPWGAKPWQTFT